MKKINRFKSLELTLFAISIIAIILVSLSMSVFSKSTKRHLPLIQVTDSLMRHIAHAHIQFEESLIKGTTIDKKREIQTHIDQALALNHFLLYDNETDLEGALTILKDKKNGSLLTSLDHHIRLLQALFVTYWEAQQDPLMQAETEKAHDGVIHSIDKFGKALQESLNLYIMKDRLWLTRFNWGAIILLGALFTGMVVLVRNNRNTMEDKNNKLKKSEARFAGIIDIADEAIISIDKDQRIIIFNKGAEGIFEYRESEVLGQKIDILIPESLRQAHHNHVDQFNRSSDTSRRMGERRQIAGRRKNGEEFAAEASISKLDLDGEKIFTVVLWDITKRKKAELILNQFKTTLDRTLDCVFIFNPQTFKFSYVNQGAMDQVGYSEKELMNMTPLDIKPEFDETQFRKHVAPLLNGSKTSLTFQTIHRHKNGTDIPVEIILQHISPHGEEPRFVAIVRDITERKRAEEALADQAIRDSLTGLYNRRYFKTRIKEEIALADRNRQIINFLICDLDGFKSINDNLGHQAGDNVLIKVSKILLDCVRGSDLVFRWGGDEFVVILPDTDRDGLLVVINRIRRSIQQLSITGCTGLDISLGVSVYPEHGATEEELIGLADRALYIAKKGGEKIHIGEEEYRLDDQAIKVVFQPIMDVRLKQFVGFEALSRDPQGKHSILALFKKYHAIGKLHELKCLCFHKQLKAGHEFRVENLFINVDFNVLKSIEVPPKPPGMDVVLEISEEEALQNVEEHLEIAAKWRSKGFKFAIDDFGAGFVSLPFIARLIPDHVKLDRSTILQAVSSERFRLVLQDLVHALRKTSTDGIIAEGIETEKELQVMKDMGVYLIQGYIFGKPQELHGPLIKP